uniref:Alpha-methylacyl-CoA racemase n=1 Tax=Panagrellus redivivus TaxID=6233 RepID=A0A7E4W1K1_PANRE
MKQPPQAKPLAGVDIVELAGLAPVPMCGQILADFGANVTLISKIGAVTDQRLLRHKDHVELDFKNDFKELRSRILKADVLLEPYRPGVLEAIGLDPVELLKENEKLIVLRLTGYGQTGQMSKVAGHDINYVAVSGLLPTIAGHNRTPYWPPANLLADFAGGALTAAFGVVSALFQRTNNGGKGVIIDASMVDGLAYLGSWITAFRDIDIFWNMPYGAFTGDCPIYRTYETKDGKFMSVGALEGKFNTKLFQILGIKTKKSTMLSEPEKLVAEIEKIFKTKTRDEWTDIFLLEEVCVSPVLDMDEVGELQHHKDRENFEKIDEKWVPKPAPRFYTAEEFALLREADNEIKKSKL